MRFAIALMFLLAPTVLGEDVEGRVKALIADLSSDEVETRDKATAALIAVGPPAEKLLEAALSAGDAEVRARAQEALDAIRLERQIGASAWVTLPEKETPLADAFRDLARQAGRELDTSSVDLAAKTLPAGLGRLALWEAVDRLARAGGCSYALPFAKTLTLEPQPLPEVPTFHDGPFRLTVDDVTVTRTLTLVGGALDATTDLMMTLEWEPHVRPMTIGSTARITAAVDDKGDSMMLPVDEEALHDRSRPDDEESPSEPCWASLGAPSSGATRIEKLEGEIVVVFLTGQEEAAFDAEARATRATLAAGPVRVQMTSWTAEEEGAIASVTITGLGAATGAMGPDVEAFGGLVETVQFTLRGADGATVLWGDLSGTTTYGGQDRADIRVGFDSVPPGDFTLVVTVVTKTHSRPVKFAFHDIPLP